MVNTQRLLLLSGSRLGAGHVMHPQIATKTLGDEREHDISLTNPRWLQGLVPLRSTLLSKVVDGKTA
jgi:hypothetical protein